jgi:hypothetical protein
MIETSSPYSDLETGKARQKVQQLLLGGHDGAT